MAEPSHESPAGMRGIMAGGRDRVKRNGGRSAPPRRRGHFALAVIDPRVRQIENEALQKLRRLDGERLLAYCQEL